MIEKLLILTTGGTIDKIYFDDKSDYQVGEPQIAGTLHHMNVAFEYEVVQLMRKDSLELDDADRSAIREAIAARLERRIVITHGTDTMTDTAAALEGVAGKTIVSPAPWPRLDLPRVMRYSMWEWRLGRSSRCRQGSTSNPSPSATTRRAICWARSIIMKSLN